MGGGWQPTAPKMHQNCVFLLIRGPKKKGAEKRPESMVWKEFPCAKRPLSAKPLSETSDERKKY